MDMSVFVDQGGFLKVEHLAAGPRRVVIASVRPGKFERPDCQFQDDTILSLNATNIRLLANAWGTESGDWVGKEVELYVGKTMYQGASRDSVLVRPISPPIPHHERTKPAPRPSAGRLPLDDDIPFAPEWR
jgi:hypothetical protein